MTSNEFTNPTREKLSQVVSVLMNYRGYWILPAIFGLTLAGLYVTAFKSETWSSKQSLMVRDDLLGQSYKPGRFESQESLKSAQETILEVARNAEVITNAMAALGPDPTNPVTTSDASAWPTEEDIESIQGSITISAPNGAEFGQTEIVVLRTKSSDRERGRKFIGLLTDEIINKVRGVRLTRLQSMEVELIQARDAAVKELNVAKTKLAEMDNQLGPDVGAMNTLNSSQSGETAMGREITSIRTEKRAIETRLDAAKLLIEMLQVAQKKPEQLLSISAKLINFQPHLSLLKNELIQTQRNLADVRGKYYAKHPGVQQALDAFEEMKRQIHTELGISIRGLVGDVDMMENDARRLDREIDRLNYRLTTLGQLRAESFVLLAQVRTRSDLANKTQTDLSAIQALTSTARDVNLITPIDEPQVSTRPDGLGKKAMILAGGLGGLMIGLGWVMLIAPPLVPTSALNRIEKLVKQNMAAGLMDSNHPSKTSTLENRRPLASAEGAAVIVPNTDSNQQGLTRRKPKSQSKSHSNERPIELAEVQTEDSKPAATRSARVQPDPSELIRRQSPPIGTNPLAELGESISNFINLDRPANDPVHPLS